MFLLCLSEYICTHLEFNPMAEKQKDPTICMTTVPEIKETQNSNKLSAWEYFHFPAANCV